MDPRVATGRNSSRAKLILTSVSAATAKLLAYILSCLFGGLQHGYQGLVLY